MIPSTIKSLALSLLDLVYPPVCAGCGKEQTHADERVCPDCFHHFRVFPSPYCGRCGAPVASVEESRPDQPCRNCPAGPIYFDRAHSLYSYEDEQVQRVIHALKFHYQTRLAPLLANLMLRGYEMFFPEERFDWLIPVPLHQSRLREREFNQSTLISKTLAERKNFQLRDDLVVRVRPTVPQASLSPARRARNLVGAFTVPCPAEIQGRRLLVVDDVMTTGATVNEVCAVLRQAGAEYLGVFTLSRALLHSFTPPSPSGRG
ncbi:MAG: double zinc ribbon domain-containing protein [bacterium]